MKTANQILIVLAVISLMSCGQLHVVTLYVDTENISQGSIDQDASFGQPAGVSNEDFTTHVQKGDRIIWDAVSIGDTENEVTITEINHIDGASIFEGTLRDFHTQSLITKQSVVKKLFAGDIKMRKVKKDSYIEEKYGIVFTVTNKGTFTIDPKIRSYK